jgi:hypothetical protein
MDDWSSIDTPQATEEAAKHQPDHVEMMKRHTISSKGRPDGFADH